MLLSSLLYTEHKRKMGKNKFVKLVCFKKDKEDVTPYLLILPILINSPIIDPAMKIINGTGVNLLPKTPM